MIWGIDVGVRSITMAGIDPRDHRLQLETITNPTPKSVINQEPHERWAELIHIADSVNALVASPNDRLYIEEPPVAGSRNLRTYGKLHQVVGAVMAASYAVTELVPVDTWKRAVVGKGGVSKAKIAEYLSESHPAYFALCHPDQNRVDATCLALYGAANRG